MQRFFIHIYQYANTFWIGIFYYFRQIERALRTGRINRNGSRIRFYVFFRPIPTGIKQHIGYIVFCCKINTSHTASRCQCNFTNYLSGLDPASVRNLIRFVQVKNEVIIFDQFSRMPGDHYITPRRSIAGQIQIDFSRQNRLYPEPSLTLLQFHAGIIDKGSFSNCDKPVIINPDHLRTIGSTFQRTQFRFEISSLCHIGHPGLAVFLKKELRLLIGYRTIPKIQLVECITERKSFIVKTNRQHHLFPVLIRLKR